MKKIYSLLAACLLFTISFAQPEEWKLGIQLWTFHISTFQQAKQWGLALSTDKILSKREVAIILEQVIHPFESREVNWHGQFLQ